MKEIVAEAIQSRDKEGQAGSETVIASIDPVIQDKNQEDKKDQDEPEVFQLEQKGDALQPAANEAPEEDKGEDKKDVDGGE